MENKTKNFHFQEMGWIICFPNVGNEGRKYLYYTVTLVDLGKKTQSQATLVDLVDSKEFENGFPHTVGFFRQSLFKEANFATDYLELRIIRCIEEFWKFLNDLNI